MFALMLHWGCSTSMQKLPMDVFTSLTWAQILSFLYCTQTSRTSSMVTQAERLGTVDCSGMSPRMSLSYCWYAGVVLVTIFSFPYDIDAGTCSWSAGSGLESGCDSLPARSVVF